MSSEVNIIIKTIDESTKNTKSVSGGLQDLSKTIAKVSGVIVGSAAAINKALDFGQQGAQVGVLSQSFDALGGNLKALQNASKGTISDFALMNATNTLLIGTSGQLKDQFLQNADQLLAIAKAANTLNPALGDTTFLYESIARGIKRSSPLILDNLGLTIEIGEANETYAKLLGKTVDQLSAEEQQQALLNDVLRAGNQLIQDAANINTEALDSFQRLDASVENLTNTIKGKLAPSLATAAQGISDLINKQAIIDGMYDEFKDRIESTSSSYSEYVDNMILGIHATRELSDAGEELIRQKLAEGDVDGKLYELYGLLTESQYVMKDAYLSTSEGMNDYAADVYGVGIATDTLTRATNEAASAYENLAGSALDLNTSLGGTIEGYLEQIQLLKGGLLPVQNDVERATQDYKNGVIGADEYQRLLNQSMVETMDIMGEFDGMSFDDVAQSIAEKLNVPLAYAKLLAEGILGALGAIDGTSVSANILLEIQQNGQLPKGVSQSLLTNPNQHANNKLGGASITAQATGGPLQQLALVGERGPEMVINGIVVPSDLTKQLMNLGLVPKNGFATGGPLIDGEYIINTTNTTSYSSVPTSPTRDRGGGHATGTAGNLQGGETSTPSSIEQAMIADIGEISSSIGVQSQQLSSIQAQQASMIARATTDAARRYEDATREITDKLDELIAKTAGIDGIASAFKQANRSSGA